MAIRAVVIGSLLLGLTGGAAHAVETAAQAAYLARCIGVLEAVIAEANGEVREEAGSLLPRMRQRVASLDLDPKALDAQADQGRQATRELQASTAIRDRLSGCREMLRIGGD